MTTDLAIVAAIVLFGGLTLAAQWWTQVQAQNTGAQLQTGATAAATATAETAIAQAEAAAPVTQQGVFDRLKAGTF